MSIRLVFIKFAAVCLLGQRFTTFTEKKGLVLHAFGDTWPKVTPKGLGVQKQVDEKVQMMSHYPSPPGPVR